MKTKAEFRYWLHHSLTQHWIDVSVQLKTQVDLTTGQKTAVSYEYEAVWTPKQEEFRKIY
jgi:hypothetical protein